MEKLEKLLYEVLKDTVTREKFAISTSALLKELELGDLETVDKSDIYLRQSILAKWITYFLLTKRGQELNDEMIEQIKKKGLTIFDSNLKGIDVLRTKVIREIRGERFAEKLAKDDEVRRDVVKQIVEIIKEMVKTVEEKTPPPQPPITT